ncbi:MAG: RnfABCDGE type electron transport complex subunit B [Rhodanobacteraceae bacterium]|jgi:electron transport complex protein RnfB|nr:RnfABCDGE type electron transport complex subunit B [Rhodanobacteraceae bacterium]
MTLIDTIDALLPQTQCTRCGYPTCRAYAEAIAAGAAEINQCPPGGAAGVAALADLLGRATKPLNPANGFEGAPIVALIDEDVCIGCTKCIQACPVDAIVGAAKRMHTVITAECTGCELCVPPCPVDCIALVPTAAQPLGRAEVLARAAQARRRFEARTARRVRATLQPSPSRGGLGGDGVDPGERDTNSIPFPASPFKGEEKGDVPPMKGDAPPITRSAVLEAIARGKARRAAGKDPSSR